MSHVQQQSGGAHFLDSGRPARQGERLEDRHISGGRMGVHLQSDDGGALRSAQSERLVLRRRPRFGPDDRQHQNHQRDL